MSDSVSGTPGLGGSLPDATDFPAPRIRACPRETVVAEKLQTMVVLGIANSRMGDFCNLRTRGASPDEATLTRRQAFRGARPNPHEAVAAEGSDETT
jgi:hypothetical protein